MSETGIKAPEDSKAANKLSQPEVDGFRKRVMALLEQWGVAVTPIVETRVKDMTTWWWLAHEYEAILRGSSVGVIAGNGETAGWKPHPAVEILAKTWERLRKAMKELENMGGQNSTPSQMGLASRMKPIIEKTQGVLEDAIEFERKKRERAAKKQRTQNAKENPR